MPTFPQCDFPSHRPPLAVEMDVVLREDCPYLPGWPAMTRGFWASTMPPETYHACMDAGFRRSGRFIYQPICLNCRLCRPIRVDVRRFAPDKSQRRCWRRNQDLLVCVGKPSPSAEKHDLYCAYMRDWHGSADVSTPESFVDFLYVSPVRTIECTCRDPAGRLLAVGICDVCSRSLSTVYFYFDPQDAGRSLGTFGALWEIQLAARLRIPWYYMGFHVAGCRAMEYKATFRPNQVLDTDGIWRCCSGQPARLR